MSECFVELLKLEAKAFVCKHAQTKPDASTNSANEREDQQAQVQVQARVLMNSIVHQLHWSWHLVSIGSGAFWRDSERVENPRASAEPSSPRVPLALGNERTQPREQSTHDMTDDSLSVAH